MLKLVDLASRPDFRAGPLSVSPSRRQVEGPAGTANLEPIVMKVLLLLFDARGAVVTRNDLFANAWGSNLVGDDSLNRAIARVRRIATETAPGLFEIETIPRTGYRLTGSILDQLDPSTEAVGEQPKRLSRRAAIGAGAASIALVAGGGWWLKRANDDRRFEALLNRGIDRMEYGDGSDEPAAILRDAAAIRPDNSAAQGLLAYSLVSNAGTVNRGTEAIAMEEAHAAARASLEADPKDPNARLALIQLERATLDLAATEDRIRAVLRDAPRSVFAMQALWNLLQSTGQSHQALSLVSRSLTARPFAAINHFPLAQLLWITGRTAEADRVIDRALIAWPDHRYVRFAKFNILAFTDRPRAALAMIDNPATRPQVYDGASVRLWRKALVALDDPSPAKVSDTRTAYLDAVKERPAIASHAVLTLSALGEVDAAFDMANKLLVFQSSSQAPSPANGDKPQKSTAWRFTPWLFTPPIASMRTDPRFVDLCDGIGLTDYWRSRGIKPDYNIGAV